MKKTRFFTFLTIIFFTAMQSANASGDAMSFNGQDGADPYAKNMTVKQWMDLVVRGLTADDLVYYTQCPQDVFATNYPAIQKPAQRILLEQLNYINKVAKNAIWVNSAGAKTTITTIADAETIVNTFVVPKPLQKGKNYTFYSADNSFNGEVGTVTRTIYNDNEMGFFLITKGGEEFLLGSALCANPLPISYMGTGGGGKAGGYEKFDTIIGGQGITLINNITIDNNSSVTNSGNSTVTAAAPATKGDAYFPGITEELGVDRARSTSTTRTTTTSTSDDVPGPTGGAVATSKSKSFTLVLSPNISWNNGNGGGGGYQQAYYPQQQRPYCPPYRPGPAPRPTPPYNGGQGYDYGGVSGGGGQVGGRGYDFDAVD